MRVDSLVRELSGLSRFPTGGIELLREEGQTWIAGPCS